MGTNENGTASVDNAHDDLGTIKGIGKKSAKALPEIGIRRFADLAQYTPETLSAALQEAGVKVAAGTIESKDWIGQARAKAELTQTETASTEVESAASKTPVETWQEHAYFSLKFEYKKDEHDQQIWQTHVYREQNGGEEAELPGISEPATWVNWILEKAKLPNVTKLPEPAEVASVSPEPEAQAPGETVESAHVKLDLLNVQISEVGPSSGAPEKRLKAEVTFHLSGEEAKSLTTRRSPYRIEIHAIDLESTVSNLVASGLGELQPQRYEYTAQQKFPIPKMGRYELHSLVLLLPPEATVAHHQGPIINIVP